PINGVLNYSQLIMESSDINSENIEYTKEIILETERISKLVSNLLLFSRKGKDSFSSARIEDIIERATILMETIFKKDQINLNVNIPEHLPSIKCRSQQIQQVLMNLLTNARDSLNDKFTDYNEDKIILVTAEEIEDDNKRWVRTIVEDHGKGISAAVQPKIFGQFFTTKDIGKGTGLGLAISLEIVKEHDGKLTFETEEGKYTKFYLDIPVKE
ncbi:MAG: GHKL domain-containing protein, partial [Clostridiales bacterium]|nr:GHKL domain-containing protein [Clostridiales bacterium]